MDSDSLKNSIKTGGIFLLTFLVFITYYFISSQNTTIRERGLLLFLSIAPVLVFSLVFYFLFKYQKDEYHNKSMFWKLPLITAIFGALVMIILTIYTASTCSGEECMETLFTIFYIPVVAIILAIVSLILTINAWYKTNLFIVAWTIFAFVFIPIILLTILSQGLEEPAVVMPFGFLVGTLLAIYFKKASPEIKKAINKGALIGGLIITLLTFIILYIIGEFKNMAFNNLEDVYNFFVVSLVIIIISVLLGSLIGYIYCKIKSRKQSSSINKIQKI